MLKHSLSAEAGAQAGKPQRISKMAFDPIHRGDQHRSLIFRYIIKKKGKAHVHAPCHFQSEVNLSFARLPVAPHGEKLNSPFLL